MALDCLLIILSMNHLDMLLKISNHFTTLRTWSQWGSWFIQILEMRFKLVFIIKLFPTMITGVFDLRLLSVFGSDMNPKTEGVMIYLPTDFAWKTSFAQMFLKSLNFHQVMAFRTLFFTIGNVSFLLVPIDMVK